MTDQATNNSQDNTGADDGGQSTSFLDGFNEDLKGNEALSSFENQDSLGQSYVDLVKAHDDLKSTIPQIPESVDGYTIDLPEGIELDGADQAAFKELALKSGLSNDTYQALVQFDLARNERVVNQVNEAKDKALQEIKDQHGDNYEAERLKVEKMLKWAAGDDEFFEGLNIEDYPKMFKILSKFGGLISEDSLRDGGTAGQGSGEKTVEQTLFGDMPGLPKR